MKHRNQPDLFDTLLASVIGMQSDIEALWDTFSIIAEKRGWEKDQIRAAIEIHRRKSAERLQEILI